MKPAYSYAELLDFLAQARYWSLEELRAAQRSCLQDMRAGLVSRDLGMAEGRLLGLAIKLKRLAQPEM